MKPPATRNVSSEEDGGQLVSGRKRYQQIAMNNRHLGHSPEATGVAMIRVNVVVK